MSLFDIPHPAHLVGEAGRPVLWFGAFVVKDEILVLCANETGRLVVFPAEAISADVRHITERENIIMGQTGPGWVDTEDLAEAPKKMTEAIFADASEAPTRDPLLTDQPASSNVTAMIEGSDYITDSSGHWYHPETGQELDKKTGKPIE